MANSEVSGGYSRVIKSRLQKKIEVFVNQELPILVQKGYVDVTEFCNVTENRNALVAQPGRELPVHEKQEEEEERTLRGSLGRELNPRPLPFRDSDKEPNLTKVTLYQAELPRQLNEQSNQLTL